MNANEIVKLAKSLGFRKARAIDSGFNAGCAFVYVYSKGRYSATCDDAFLVFGKGEVDGPDYPAGNRSVWSKRPCATMEAVRAELTAALPHVA